EADSAASIVLKVVPTAEIRTPERVTDAPSVAPAGKLMITIPDSAAIAPIVDAASPPVPLTLMPAVDGKRTFAKKNSRVRACVVPDDTVKVTVPTNSVYPVLAKTVDELETPKVAWANAE